MKKPSVSKLKKKLDIIFSRYIRQKYANHAGMVQCFTCKRSFHWKKIQCGHFVPRQYNSTRYVEKNNHPQCYACNMFYGGQPDQYAVELKKKYGDGIIEELNTLRHETKKWSVQELEELIEYYNQELKKWE